MTVIEELSFAKFCIRKVWRLVYITLFCLPGACASLILLAVICAGIVVRIEENAELQQYKVLLRRSEVMEAELLEKAREVFVITRKNATDEQALDEISDVLKDLTRSVEQCVKEKRCNVATPVYKGIWNFGTTFFFAWSALSSVMIVEIEPTMAATRIFIVLTTLIGIPVYVNFVENSANFFANFLRKIYLKRNPEKRRQIEEEYMENNDLTERIPLLDDEQTDATGEESPLVDMFLSIGDYLLFGIPRYINMTRKVASGKFVLKTIDKAAYFTLMEQRKEMLESIRFHFSVALGMLCTYVMIGIVFVTNVEGWSILESIFFIVTRVFTVDSDLIPAEREDASQTFAIRAFVVIYAAFGLALAVAAIQLTDTEAMDSTMKDIEMKSTEPDVEKVKTNIAVRA